MSNKRAFTITAIVAVFFGLFFLYPVIEIIKVAFQDGDKSFTWDYVLAVFMNPNYLSGLWNALTLGIASTALTFLIALPLALASYRWVFPGKKWLVVLILVPLVLPPFVGAVGVKHIMGVQGALNALLIDLGMMSQENPVDWLGNGKFWGVVIMNALHLYPILFINVLAALNKLDPAMEQAAQNLGASPWTRFKKITLPLCMPGVFAGAAIVFIWSFTELGVPLVFDYTEVASVQVYDGLKDLSSNPTPYAIVAVMLFISLLVFGISKLIFGRNNLGTSPRPSARYAQKTVNGPFGWAVSALFMLIFMVAAIPHCGVLFLSVSGDWYGTILPESMTMNHYAEGLSHPVVVGSIKNSLIYSLGATILNVVMGLAIAWVIVRSKIWGRNLLDALLMLPLAVPGLVLAFGYRALSDEGGAFHFLVGTTSNPIFLLILAYSVRRLPYVVRAAVAGLQQSDPVLEEAAMTLGANRRRTFFRIGLPLIGSSLAAGAILAFAFAMLEVSDSLILAEQSQHFPVTKAIYALISMLGNGNEVAAALGVWAMIFLAIAIGAAFIFVGKKCGSLFRM